MEMIDFDPETRTAVFCDEDGKTCKLDFVGFNPITKEAIFCGAGTEIINSRPPTYGDDVVCRCGDGEDLIYGYFGVYSRVRHPRLNCLRRASRFSKR